jgi:nucleoside-diphosphate-sugar epimerase
MAKLCLDESYQKKMKMMKSNSIINPDDLILITGASGFIGSKVIRTLLDYGFTNLRCFVRPSSNLSILNPIVDSIENANIEVVKGNLLSIDNCEEAVNRASVIYHLAAGIEKTFAGSYMNSVITTRNLLDACLKGEQLKRFVNVSSFTVYSGDKMSRGSVMDETCEVESNPVERCSAYCYGKVKQDELINEYGNKFNVPYVIVRPGAVFGPGKKAISGRVGIDTFGIFLHLGGSNRIPLTYIDNCAEAIVLAGVKQGIDGMVFNVVDDNIPTSREFLRKYKKEVKKFRSIYIPHIVWWAFCYLWESYSIWSQGQLPSVFNRNKWAAEWKGAVYSNQKAKHLLGWRPRVQMEEGLNRYFIYQREGED